jgi:hypothetical protein
LESCNTIINCDKLMEYLLSANQNILKTNNEPTFVTRVSVCMNYEPHGHIPLSDYLKKLKS